MSNLPVATPSDLAMVDNMNKVENIFDTKPAASAASASSGDAAITNNTSSVADDAPPAPPPRTKRQSDKRYVVELKADEVRWFYKRQVDDTKWRPFNGCDSLLLEVRWRQKNDVPIDRKTVEQVALLCKVPTVVVLDGLYKLSEGGAEVTPIYWNDSALELRRGTWFLAENYQPINAEYATKIEEHHLKHFRGQVVLDGQLFFEKDTSKKPILTELKLEHSTTARWNSVVDVTLFSTSAKSRFLRYLSLGKGASLVRGYKDAAILSDSPKPIGHVIFVIHGIGQKGYEGLIAKHTDTMRDMAESYFEKHYDKEKTRPVFLPVEWRARLTLDNSLTDHITLRYMEAMRNALNSTAMDIMYYQSPLYRQEIVGGMVRVLNQMYAMFIEHNPGFNGQVSFFAHSLGSVMAYDILTGWSPLLLYDQFVTHMIAQRIAEAEGDNRQVLEQLQDARAQIHNLEGGVEAVLRSAEDKLNFTVANLFCVGSPLGVFLAMRGQEATNVIPKFECVQRIYNIFHPADPVAYRLEPLIHPDYRHIRPVKIHGYHDARLKTSYAVMPMEMHKRSLRKISVKKAPKKESINPATGTEIGVDATQADENGEREEDEGDDDEGDDESDTESSPESSMRNQPGSGESSPRSGTPVSELTAPSSKRWWKFGKSTADKTAVEIGKEVATEAATAIVKKITPLETLLEGITHDFRLERRLDYSLRQGLTEVSYWSVLKSHFTYWTHHDLIMFMLTQLYDER